MDSAKVIATLEFTTVRAMLADVTSFPPGRELAQTLEPAHDLAIAERLQDETDSARALLRAVPSAGLAGARDIRDPLRRATLGGSLDPEQLLMVADTTRAASRLFADVRGHPPLAAKARFARPPEPLATAIEHAIGSGGEVLDRASVALANARAALRAAQSRLQQRLDALVRSPELGRFLQEPIVTQRSGRYVVPVKAEHRGAVKGIVHDQSASGQTVFIEPLDVLEANNAVREAELAEQQEVQRVLERLSRSVEAAAEDLSAILRALAEIDIILAKAHLAESLACERPVLNGEGRADLIAARHPLLVIQGGDVVPIDIGLGRDFRVLVITGPNTGGKTVTLKTIGILQLMAASGLQVPAARGSELPVVRHVFADIGDDQSIAQSLSTFSSHLRNVVATLAEAQSGDIALLDEVGAGTDPDEGAALAMAVLETLLERGVLVAASTHYPELKAFALNTPGVSNASVEFDAETLRPTYRVHVGLPGSSNAFAIASRLGLDRGVLDRAEAHLSELHRSLERTLQLAERQRTELAASVEESRIAAADAARALTDAEAEADRIRADAERSRDRARHESEELVLQARRTLRQAEEARDHGGRRNLVEEAREALAASERMRRELTPEPFVARARTVSIGGPVLIRGMTEEGTLVSIDQRGIAEVVSGQLRLRVPSEDLLPAPPRDALPIVSTRPQVTGSAANAPLQLDLRGARAEEALEVLDRYLNDAAVAGHDRVRIVHGKGTGALRAAVRETLARHPLVHAQSPAGPAEGGDGATIVKL